MSNFKVDSDCIFCKIVNGSAPCHKILETEHSFAFLDIMPITEGHTQVIPKHHGKTLADLPDEYLRDIGPVVRTVALLTGVEQYNIVQNNGTMAYQHIDHVHFHVIPKPSPNEGLLLTNEQNWPAPMAKSEDLVATCEKMKGRL